MDENNYRSTYSEINELPCVFEKGILQQCCQCENAKHFNLAERIGVACTVSSAQKQCTQFLTIMREKSIFALQLASTGDGKLPHAKEIKIQCGGVNGLIELLGNENAEKNVSQLIQQNLAGAPSMNALPYEQIVRSVARFEGRKRRRGR